MRTRNLTASTVLVLCSLGTGAARATPILDLTLTNPDQVVTQGATTLAFDATLANTSATDTLYLNGDSATTSSSLLTVDDSPFFANAPLSLAPGQSTGPFELFDVDLSATTAVGVYDLNTFSILGGADGGTFSDFMDIADAPFSVTVNPAPTAAVPEPSTLSLLGVGLAGLALARRRRMDQRSK